MSIPAAALAGGQIGVETTPGTPVPANRQLFATSFDIDPELIGREPFTALGSLYPTALVPGVELASGDLEGTLSFTDATYILSGYLGAVSATAIEDGGTPTGAYERTWTPPANNWSTPVTYTLETGYRGGQLYRVAGVFISSLQLEVQPMSVSVRGRILGGRHEAIANFTASPTEIAVVLPDYLRSELRVASTLSDLDTASPFVGAFRANLDLGERYSRTFPIGLTRAIMVPQQHEPRAELTLALDADGAAEIEKLRNNTRVYLRLQVEGPVIYSAGSVTIRHQLRIDMACYYLEWSKEEQDGVGVVQLAAVGVADSALGGAYRVRLINNLASL